MTLEGTVVKGMIVLDGAAQLPEGARVRVELASDRDEEWENSPLPPTTETREEVLTSLRESIAEVQAGIPGLTVGEAFADVDAELRRLAAERSK